MIGIVSAALAMYAGQAQSLQATPDCSHDRAAMLAMDLDAFDQTYESGWRTLANIKGCEAAAADLIADWRARNAPDNPSLMRWHEGQLRAAAGDAEGAIQSMRLSAAEEEAAGDMADLAYKQATIAFLERDRDSLTDWRDRLAATPRPEGFDEAADKFEAEYGWRPLWPSNLNVVDGLIACFDQPYAVAYTTECQPGSGPSATEE